MTDWFPSSPIWLLSQRSLKGINENDLMKIGKDGDYRLIHKAKGHFDGNANALGALCINVGKDDAFGICSSNEKGPGQNALLEVKGGNGDLFVKGDLKVTGIDASSIVKAPGLRINGAATVEKGLTVGSAPSDMLDINGAIRFNNIDGSKIQLISEEHFSGKLNNLQIGSSELDGVNIETDLKVGPNHRIIIYGPSSAHISLSQKSIPIITFVDPDKRIEIDGDSIYCYYSGLRIGTIYGDEVTINTDLVVEGNIKLNGKKPVVGFPGLLEQTTYSIDLSEKLYDLEYRIAALER